MDELKIHDNVFPFVCDKCNSKYDLEGFTNVIQLWGFIYLTKGEHNLIGITCPDCCCTTLRKFPSYTPDFSREALEKQGTLKRYLGETEHYAAPEIKYFVPFSAKILAGLSLVSLPNIQEDDKKGDSYRIPYGFEQTMYAYPQHISEEFPYSFEESNISVLCDIENNEKISVILAQLKLMSIKRFKRNIYKISQNDFIEIKKKLKGFFS